MAAAAVTSALVTPAARPRPRTRRPVIEEPRVDNDELTARVEYDDEYDNEGLVCVIDENGFKSCAPAGPGLEWYEDELVSNERKLEAVEAKLEKLKAEKKLLVAKQKELTSVYDELRFEVRNAGLNGPILAFVFCAALVALLWKDLFIVISLYENDAYMEADWLPESRSIVPHQAADGLPPPTTRWRCNLDARPHEGGHVVRVVLGRRSHGASGGRGGAAWASSTCLGPRATVCWASSCTDRSSTSGSFLRRPIRAPLMGAA